MSDTKNPTVGLAAISGLREPQSDEEREAFANHEAMEDASFDNERLLRHALATKLSDDEFIRGVLVGAAQTFDDIAEMIEKKQDYDPAPYMRIYARRLRRVATRCK